MAHSRATGHDDGNLAASREPYQPLMLDDSMSESDGDSWDSMTWSTSNRSKGLGGFITGLFKDRTSRYAFWSHESTGAPKSTINGSSKWWTIAILTLTFALALQTLRIGSLRHKLASLDAASRHQSTTTPSNGSLDKQREQATPVTTDRLEDGHGQIVNNGNTTTHSALPSDRFLEIAQGSWVPPSRPWTAADVKERYGMNPLGNVGNLGQHRLVQLNAFEWKPSNRAGRLHKWSTFEFLKRCLNSEAGFLLVGDSVSMQSYETLGGLLKLVSSEFSNMTWQARSQWLINKEVRFPSGDVHYVYTIKNGSAMQTLLHAHLPNVPVERLRQPFARAIRHDTLLHPDVITELAEGQDGLRTTPVFKDWLKHDAWSAALPTGAVTWPGQDNSILLINTGAHWSRICFGVPERDNVIELATAVAKQVVPQILNHPNLDVIYRSTSPGHPKCEKAYTPVYPALPFVDHDDHKDTRDVDWGWKQFEDINSVFKTEIDSFTLDRQLGQHDNDEEVLRSRQSNRQRGTRAAYLDVSEMSGQRPDAHKGNGDCLHWALPSVPAHWLRMAWHVLEEWRIEGGS
ncbi:hypothetical protein OIO90_003348 [Microbotryomycetes sp. JL221]|nr:hypothetical protein OIO90_003348 [Microbotryomycetes sp. JL221]